MLNACPNLNLALIFNSKEEAKPVMRVAAKRAFRVLIRGRRLESDVFELLQGCDNVEEMTFVECHPEHFSVRLPSLKCLDLKTVEQDLSGKLVHFLADNTGSLEICSINGSWGLPQDVHTLLQKNKKIQIFSLTVEWTNRQEQFFPDRPDEADKRVSTYLATLVVTCSRAASLNEIHLDVRNRKTTLTRPTMSEIPR